MVPALYKAKFLIVPVKSKSRVEILTPFELELLEELMFYYKNGQRFKDRVNVEGFLHRKASFVLVRKGLAAYVKDVLYPSRKFGEVFVPLFHSAEGDCEQERMCSAYDRFLSAK